MKRRWGLAILTFAGVALCLPFLDYDVWRYYFDDPTACEGVRVVEGNASAPVAPRMAHDFDGDGIPDTFEVEYLRLEPVFAMGTSGMLRVHSGRGGADLLVCPTETPICTAVWAGDLDGNGTDDLFDPVLQRSYRMRPGR